MEKDSLAPQILLALAKDSRYVGNVRRLVSNWMQQIVPTLRETDVPSWAVAAALYALLVIGSKGRSLGMEASGLQYNLPLNFPLARVQLAVASLATVVSISMLRHRLTRSDRRETLRGEERRRRFERQRQQMYRRAASQHNATAINNNNARTTTTRRSSIVQRARDLFQKACIVLSDAAMSDYSGGLHDVPLNPQGADFSYAHWLVRLLIAYHCLDGVLSIRGSGATGFGVASDGTKALVNQPKTARLVGLLLFSQAGGHLLFYLLKRFLRVLIRARRRRLLNNEINIAKAEDSQSADEPSDTSCAICQGPRQHPSCPVGCGHVFCWKCLQQWVVARSECPFCRHPCRPQDVLPLQDYVPS